MSEQSSNAEAVHAGNWRSAQALSLSIDPLVPKALQLLHFLEQVDHHRNFFYQTGPALSRAIKRYEDCWLPLLAEHGSSSTCSTPLQPPLDCAWIWHCHRLNPIAYARDCELLYGRLVGAPPTMDTAEVIESSRRLWEVQFPQEKYHLDLTQFQRVNQRQPSAIAKQMTRIQYNLEEAALRQSSFYYQVSQPHMREESFLGAAAQRYKGFLHLFKMTGCKCFLVPTYDIDLMWHAHQLNPEAYAEDLTRILGKVLEHDDTESDRSPGQKLDEGFEQTCQQWQKCYGVTYQRAGAMYRGEPPAPVQFSAPAPNANKHTTALGMPLDFTPLVPRELMQVSIAIFKARNVHKKQGDLRVRLKMQRKCSTFKLETASIPFLSELVWNQNWAFEAEKSTDCLQLELLRKHSNAFKQKIVGSEILGVAYFSWEQLLATPTLSYDGWLSMSRMATSGSFHIDEKPPSLLVSISLTPPQPAPQLFRTINSIPTDDSCCMIEGSAKRGHGCWLTKTVLDHTNRVVFIVRSRHSDGSTPTPEDERCLHIHQGEWEYPDSYTNVGSAPAKIVTRAKQLISARDTPAILFMQRCWGFFDNSSGLTVSRAMGDPMWNIRPLLKIHGSLSNQIQLVCGRKLDYEVKGATDEEEGGFVTLMRYNPVDSPLGRATALFNWRTGAMEVSPNESVVLVLLLSNIIATSVYNMEGLKIKLNSSRGAPPRQTASPDEWGAVVMTTRSGWSTTSRRDAMVPYYCWWDMSPMIWATYFYSPGNGLLGASRCGAAGACGGGCGGSACGGGGGGGGCGGGGCGGGD
ncbi:hypothetical protein L7F22_056696 [Adiantum nelumboides]|nr:hypothetical protein [Adiantum nelumboides]